jgi:spore maturation protein CgeB
MRTFEVPRVGGCMLVEDTEEHRALFGPNDHAVRYFQTTDELVGSAKQLIADGNLRQRLAAAAHRLIVRGPHTYKDRLASILADTTVATNVA